MDAGITGASISKMSDSFSGVKLVAEATRAAGVIAALGGTSKLTAAELEKFSQIANDAAAKLTAMGRDVPQNIRLLKEVIDQAKGSTGGLGDETKNTTKQFSQMDGVVQGLQQQLLGMFTIGAVIAFGKEVIDAGDKIQKMADQTGLSTDEVQKLNYIAGQSGSSIESLIGAVQNLQVRLGDENSGAAGAFAKLGISADAFNKLSTYAQMTTLSEAIRTIKDPTEQASVAAALFGKTWKEILPAIKSGMQEVGDQAPIMAENTVKALDRVGDAMTASKQQAIARGGVVVAIEGAGYAFGQFLSKLDPAHLGVTNDQLLKMLAALNDKTGLAGAMARIPAPAKEVAAQLGSIALSSAQAAEIGKDQNRQGEESVKKSTRRRPRRWRSWLLIERFRDSVKSFSFGTFVADTSKLNAVIPDLSGHIETMAAVFADARDHMDDLDASVSPSTRRRSRRQMESVALQRRSRRCRMSCRRSRHRTNPRATVCWSCE